MLADWMPYSETLQEYAPDPMLVSSVKVQNRIEMHWKKKTNNLKLKEQSSQSEKCHYLLTLMLHAVISF